MKVNDLVEILEDMPLYIDILYVGHDDGCGYIEGPGCSCTRTTMRFLTEDDVMFYGEYKGGDGMTKKNAVFIGA